MADKFSFSNVGSKANVTYDAGLRRFMLSTYNYMALGVAFTGVITLWLSLHPEVLRVIAQGPAMWVLFGATLLLGFFAPRIILQSRQLAVAHLAYWGYAALLATMISPMIYYFLNTAGGVADIARAFFITAGMFAACSIYGYTTRRNLMGLSLFLFMAVIGIMLASLVNLFLKSTGFSLILSYITVGIFAVITAYETQMLKGQYDEFNRAGGDMVKRLGILGALMLYGSFINIFINILNIMALSRRD